MKGKGRRERRQASLRTIDVSAKDQRNRRSKWYAKASCRGGLIRIADWRMRGGPSIRNARMRRMIRVDLTNSAISIVGKRLETISYERRPLALQQSTKIALKRYVRGKKNRLANQLSIFPYLVYLIESNDKTFERFHQQSLSLISFKRTIVSL